MSLLLIVGEVQVAPVRAIEALLGGFLTQISFGGKTTGEHGFGDAGDRYGQRQCGLHGPRAGALHASMVDDHVNQRLTGLLVGLMQHFGGDFDQIGVSSVLFHSSNTSPISAGVMPERRHDRSFQR